MTKEQLLECEARRINKLYLLPNKYKKFGVALLILAVAALLIFKFMDGEFVIAKDLAKKGLLVGLLFISISKDKIEDERASKLRSQSYTWAFIFGVGYTIVAPYISYAVKYIFKPEKAIFAELDVFVILWFMLCIQLLFFHTLKSAR
jgi:uncharacterized membrane protein